MTKQIPLTKGLYALVDDDDYEKLKGYKWHAQKSTYAARYNPDEYKNKKIHTKIFMHRVIAETPEGMFTDHINGNTLDNRKCNLRICTKSQNRVNSGLDSHNKSGFKGVFWDKSNRRWVAHISRGEKIIWSRYCRKIEDAVAAYDEQLKIIFGEYAKTNAEIRGNV